jgi:LSD1 subclass zinc finger protein
VPLFKEDLDRQMNAGCSNPDCTADHKIGEEMYLSSKCHLGAPNFVTYREGVVIVRCSICQDIVLEIEVASQADDISPPGSWKNRLH